MTTGQDSTSWDLAGIRPERPIGDSSVWAPPPLDCMDGVLRYEVGKRQLRTVDRSMLSDFLRLAEAQDDDVYRFSVKWGALGLCQHGLPYWHSAACSQRNSSGNIRSEKVEDWRTMAAAFKSLINISGELNQGRTGLIDDWRFADRRLSEPDFQAWDDDVLRGVLMERSDRKSTR